MTWKLNDIGDDDYLDGLKSQYEIQRADGESVGWIFKEADARIAASAADMVVAVGNLLDHWEQLPNDLKSDPGMDRFSEAIEGIYLAIEQDEEDSE